MVRPFIKKLELSNIHKAAMISTPKKLVLLSKDTTAKEANSTIVMGEIEDVSGMGYHDEFMSRMSEFSLSWRKAAEKERKPHSNY